jgi:hypothetical protein
MTKQDWNTPMEAQVTCPLCDGTGRRRHPIDAAQLAAYIAQWEVK